MIVGECNGCGACCKFVTVNIHPVYLDPDKRKWLELHEGITVFERQGMAYLAIQTSCKHLTEDNKCGIFGQPERPQTCAEFPFDQFDIDYIDKWAGEKVCSYEVVETY